MHAISGFYPHRIVPFVRVRRGERRADANAYRTSRKQLVEALTSIFWTLDPPTRAAWKAAGCLFTQPVLIGLALHVPVTAQGTIPRNRGDFDNYIKALLDALVDAKVLEDDSLWHVRGVVGTFEHEGHTYASRVHPTPPGTPWEARWAVVPCEGLSHDLVGRPSQPPPPGDTP